MVRKSRWLIFPIAVAVFFQSASAQEKLLTFWDLMTLNNAGSCWTTARGIFADTSRWPPLGAESCRSCYGRVSVPHQVKDFVAPPPKDKQLARGSFEFPQPPDQESATVEIRASELSMLLDGIELKGRRRRPRYERPS